MANTSIEEQLAALRDGIQERALRLCDLEVIIRDYVRERERLLEEIVDLKEQYWDLMGSGYSARKEP